MKFVIGVLLIGLASVLLVGCQTNSKKQLLETTESQVKLRSFQTRAFDTSDKRKVMRSVISTLQDLDFVVSNADILLGTVSGSKYGTAQHAPYELKMTVTVRPRGDIQMLVRANAQYNIQAVEDPQPYQDFFAALEKSLFLTGQNVD